MSAECLYDVRGKSVLCPWNVHAVFVDQSRCIFYTVYAQQFVNLVNGYVLMQSRRRYPTIHNSPIIVTKKTIASQVVNRSQRDEESQQFVIIVFVRKECKASRYFRSHKFISAIIRTLSEVSVDRCEVFADASRNSALCRTWICGLPIRTVSSVENISYLWHVLYLAFKSAFPQCLHSYSESTKCYCCNTLCNDPGGRNPRHLIILKQAVVLQWADWHYLNGVSITPMAVVYV